MIYRPIPDPVPRKLVRSSYPRLGEPRALFEGAYRPGRDEGYTYAVARDDSRFLMIRHDDADYTASKLTVVLNWFEELETIAPSE